MSYFNLKRILEKISYEPQLTILAQITKDEDDGAEVDRRRFCINDQWYILVDSDRAKVLIGPDYNYLFVKETGFFKRWGRMIEEEPLYSPIGPEILYIKISDKMNSNFMELNTFKLIVNKIPKSLIKIKFEINSIDENFDLIGMIYYCYDIGIVPGLSLLSVNDIDRRQLMYSISGYNKCKNNKILNIESNIERLDRSKILFGNFDTSLYINAEGEILKVPDNTRSNRQYIDILAIDDFMNEVWYSDIAYEMRKQFLAIK